MPQQTNLNVSPYFDDFDSDKDFHKVLFKPGFPVQARELTTLQSILQNQIEKFGQHFFKEGSMVIPGATGVDFNYDGVKIDSTFFGVPVSSYLDKLIGVEIRGATSGVKAKVVNIIPAAESEQGFDTLYLKYTESNPSNGYQEFLDGESLQTLSNIIYGSSLITSGSTFANTIAANAIFKASSVTINDGVFFTRGYFVSVKKQTIILDQYNNRPSARVGLLVEESIISSLDDPSLNDNSQGFSNYAAPGADRLKISLILFKKGIDDFNDQNFIELIRLNEGSIEKFVDRSSYNLIRDELARRTYDESGDYTVKSFDVFPRETLNNLMGNNGLYGSNQLTPDGNTPSDDLLTYQIMPGKAYVRGYDIETISPTYLDTNKPRTTVGVPTSGISIDNGTTIKINNVSGFPLVGYNYNSVIDLRNRRRDLTTGHVGIATIGTARVYDLITDNRYQDSTTEYQIYLYDIQTYSTVGVNTLGNVGNFLQVPAYIKGKSSGASGYLKYNVSSGNLNLTLTNVSGKFIENESLIVNGIEENIYTTSVTDYNLGDIKSLYQAKTAGINTHFNADTVLNVAVPLTNTASEFTIHGDFATDPVGVLTASNSSLSRLAKVDDILAYSKPGDTVLTFNRITSVGANGRELSFTGITTVSGVCDGSIPTGQLQTSNVVVLKPSFSIKNRGSFLNLLKYRDISSVDLTQGDIEITYQFTVDASSGSFTIDLDSIADFQDQPDVRWKAFSTGNYKFVNSSGQVIPISSGNIIIANRVLTVTGINAARIGVTGTTNSTLIASLDKQSIKSKVKKFNSIGDLTISRSRNSSAGIGTTTLNNGLTYSTVYGTRVEDDKISLNVPDVFRVYGIYESSNENDPVLPTLTLSNITGPSGTNSDFIIGEVIQSVLGKAKAIVVSKIDNDKLEIQYLNDSKFSANEDFISIKSVITAKCTSVSLGDKNIVSDYYFDNGIQPEYYDYSRIIRAPKTSSPKRRIRVIFQKYTIDDSDRGDFFTINSYPADVYQSIPLIQYFDGYVRNSDGIDIRPRVKDYDLATNTRSPFEFDGKDFSEAKTHPEFNLTPRTIVEIAYKHYVGRIDKIFLTRDGKFIVSQGVPSETPQPPSNEDSALEIGTAYLPPYVYNAKQIKFLKTESKRYTMKDIAKIDSRLSNVEFYTSLSLLENDTNALTIKDPATGLDRFKSGFFVDNFKSLSLINAGDPNWGCSIDRENGLARPMHHTPSVDLQLGSSAISGVAATTNTNIDIAFVTDLGNPNVRKTGDLITLDYTEVEYQSQKFATRTENVNPFNIVNWSGSMELEPASDIWIETSKPTINNVSFEGSYQAFMDLYPPEADGWSAIQWNAWEENFAGRTETPKNVGSPVELSRRSEFGNWELTGNVDRSRVHVISNGALELISSGDPAAQSLISGLSEVTSASAAAGGVPGFGSADSGIGEVEVSRSRNDIVSEAQQVEITVNREFNRTGVSYKVSESIDTQSLGNKIVNRDVIPFMRLRNIEFIAKRMKPSTRVYAFFDGVDVNQYIIPKLIEIEMLTGVFQEGEQVVGILPTDDPSLVGDGINPRIAFRLANSDHKYGPYNSPTAVYEINPYDQSTPMETTYSATSALLNVDTYSLADITQSGLGWIGLGQILTGRTSGAQARITNIRLVSDENGSLRGCFFIPDPNVTLNPKFQTGNKTFKLTDSITNSNVGGAVNSSAESNFFASGELDNLQEDVISIRNARIEKKDHTDRKTESETRQEVRFNTRNEPVEDEVRWIDPLCQSFVTGNGSGVYLTSVDIYFQTKSETIPITLQIRTLRNGNPTQQVVPFGEIVLDPNQVVISEDGSVATRFTFVSPVYLEANREFGITLLSNSDEYNVFISRMGEVDISTLANDESAQIIVSQQPSAGVLFKSQNGSTWTANQYEDLKYVINKARFVTDTGTVRFYNPPLSEENNLIRRLRDNPITMNSRQIKIGISTIIAADQLTNLSSGVSIAQPGNTGFSGKIIGLGGSITNSNTSISIDNVGVGITPLSGAFSYENITISSETGTGATCSIRVVDGTVGVVTVYSGGSGYQVGQRLIIDPTNFAQIGNETPLLSVVSLGSTDTVFVDDVQGEFNTLSTIQYVNDVGVAVTFVSNTPNVVSVFPNSSRDGLHMSVLYYGHGMHASNNLVNITNVTSDTQPEILLEEMANTSTTDIIIAGSGSTSIIVPFSTFENISVGSTNPGYVKINDEIIRYTGINAAYTGLTGITRGLFNTLQSRHDVNSYVTKYELNGLSLARINKTHNFNDVLVSVSTARDLDNFYVKIDSSGQVDGSTVLIADRTGSGDFHKLYFNETKVGGGVNVKASKNIQFELIHPNVQVFTPADTSIDAAVRTTSATSIGAVQNGVPETSFIDNGFEPIVLNENNTFNTPRMIASRVNELQYLDDLPGNRSFTLELNLNTNQVDISPVVDINRVNAILTTNRINKPVTDFVNNGDIMSSFSDPHAAVYVSRAISLDNPATSIKLMFSGNRPPGTEIRALYKIFRNDGSSNPDYELFPGFNNLNENGEVIDARNNNGLPNSAVPINSSESEYLEYEFSADNLPEFKAYAVKVIFTSTNQAFVPTIKDLRIIGLA